MQRQPFLDHLRAVLTALVVFHHTALTYGAIGGWYWQERAPGSSVLLVLFCTVNQAFFMGLFFLIAGSLTPAAYGRKGPGRFLRERAWRLGVPLMLYLLVISPFTIALSAPNPAGFWRRLAAPQFEAGPLWFAEALLIFAAIYAGVRALFPARPAGGPPGHGLLLGSALAVGAAAFAIRLAYPVNAVLLWMQPGYFASYAVLFAAGVWGAWLERVRLTVAVVWGVVAVGAFGIGIGAALRPGPHRFIGGWNWDAVIYAFWEPFLGWGVILLLLWGFHRWSNAPSVVFDWLGRRAFACYVLHPPVLVGIARGLQGWRAGPLLKTAAVGSLACLGCLVLSSLVLRTPGLRRVF